MIIIPELRQAGRHLLYLASVFVALTIFIVAYSGTSTRAEEASNAGEYTAYAQSANTPESEIISHWWRVTNHANQPVWGQLTKQKGSHTSEIGFTHDAKMDPGVTAQTQQSDDSPFAIEYTWGRFCYLGLWWNLPRKNYPHAGSLTLESAWDDPGRLTIKNKYQEFALVETSGEDCSTRA